MDAVEITVVVNGKRVIFSTLGGSLQSPLRLILDGVVMRGIDPAERLFQLAELGACYQLLDQLQAKLKIQGGVT